MDEPHTLSRFEEAMLPSFSGAYTLGRWVTRKAFLRAFKSFHGFRGGDGRAWLLTTVRNTCYTWLQANRAQELTMSFDEEMHSRENECRNPEALLLKRADNQRLKEILEELPLQFREVIVLRELEGMSYREITGVLAIPVGTVMSRLVRARERLERRLTPSVKETGRELPRE